MLIACIAEIILITIVRSDWPPWKASCAEIQSDLD